MGINACQGCSKPFTMTNRRHHCRRCGHLVCAECAPTSNKVRLPELGYNHKVRVCTHPACAVQGFNIPGGPPLKKEEPDSPYLSGASSLATSGDSDSSEDTNPLQQCESKCVLSGIGGF